MYQKSVERITRRWTPAEADAVFELDNGSRMDQKTFHALYLKTPESFKAELIGGVVFVMSSPVSPRHGKPHARVVRWLGLYADGTPGTDVWDNTSSILSEESETQPDACLLVLPEFGGRATIVEDESISGPLDLVVEVANTTRVIDLGSKMLDYERAGVREYVVVLAKEQGVRWFHRGRTGFKEVVAAVDGLYRSKAFPGLWLDPRGLFSETTRPLTVAVRKGLATLEHKTFATALKVRREKSKRKSK